MKVSNSTQAFNLKSKQGPKTAILHVHVFFFFFFIISKVKTQKRFKPDAFFYWENIQQIKNLQATNGQTASFTRKRQPHVIVAWSCTATKRWAESRFVFFLSVCLSFFLYMHFFFFFLQFSFKRNTVSVRLSPVKDRLSTVCPLCLQLFYLNLFRLLIDFCCCCCCYAAGDRLW